MSNEKIIINNVDLLSLKKEISRSFINDDKEDIALSVDRVNDKDISCQKVGKYDVYFVKTDKGVIWKQGILVSDVFNSVTQAFKDAKKALL